jgi:protein-S-isoprenylcysteine O-methyltransferase Ste14
LAHRVDGELSARLANYFVLAARDQYHRLMPVDFLLLAALWTAYCAAHSALISVTATRLFRKALGSGYRFYRLGFNAFSTVTLVLLILYSRAPRFQGGTVFAWSGQWRIFQYTLIALGAALAVSGARHYDMQQFLGVRQIRGLARIGMTQSGNFDRTGILGLVRHPWYTAVFILLWAGDQNAASITINLVLSAYLVIGTILEERKLVFEFGDEYRRYRSDVSMFIPIRWLGAKIHGMK